jgi:hypothetical protein
MTLKCHCCYFFALLLCDLFISVMKCCCECEREKNASNSPSNNPLDFCCYFLSTSYRKLSSTFDPHRCTNIFLTLLSKLGHNHTPRLILAQAMTIQVLQVCPLPHSYSRFFVSFLALYCFTTIFIYIHEMLL